MDHLLSGRVGERPFPKVIYALCAHGFTGALVLEQEQLSWRVWFRGGVIVDADSSSPEDGFARVMVAEGLLEPGLLSELLRRMAQNAERSGAAVLGEMKGWSPAETAKAARIGLIARARRVFGLVDATYRTEALDTTRDDGGPLDPRWLIYRGLRAHYDGGRLGRDLTPLESYAIKLDPGPGYEERVSVFGFGDEERYVMAYLTKGYWCLPDLVDACIGLPQTTVCSLVYTLLACELLDVKPATSVPRLRKRAKEETMNVGPSAAAAVRAGTPAARGAPKPANPPSIPPPAVPAKTPAIVTPAGAGDTKAVRAQIAAKLAQVEAGLDHYKLLEVPVGAPAADIKAAYFRLAKVFHPDRIAILKIEDVRASVERCFAKIGEAFAVLSDDKRRADYKKVVDAGGEAALKKKEAEEQALAMKLIDAEEHFRQGEMALRRGNHAQALEEFKLACEMNPDEAEHHALFAWATFMAAGDKDHAIGRVKQLFAHALEVNKECAPAYFYLGHVYNWQQDFGRAIAQFQRALEIRPGWTDAERELRVLEMRRQKGALSPGKSSQSLNPFRKK